MTQTPFRSSFIDRGFFISICIFVSVLPIRPPFLHNIQAYALILFLIFALLKIFVNKDFNIKRKIPEVLLLSGLFLWWTFTLFYTENLSLGAKYLETKLGLILIPFFMITTSDKKSLNINRILLIYAGSVSFFMLVSYISILFQNYEYNKFDHVVWVFFLYHSLVRFIGMHAVYMSIQVAFAFLIVLNYFTANHHNLKLKVIQIVWMSFLLICIVCLTVKMVALGFLISTIAFLIFRLQYKNAILISTSIFVGLILIITHFSDQNWFRERMDFSTEALNKKYSESPQNLDGSWGSVNLRFALAKNALEVISEHPIFGKGIGDGKEARLIKYEENSFYYALNEEYNEHNQYLNILLTSGLIGLGIFLLMIIVQTLNSIQNNDPLFLSFIILISISFLAENYLSRLHGVSFFAIFHSLLWMRNKTILSK